MFYGTPRKVKTEVAKWLDDRQPKRAKAEKATLEDVVKAYREMPKRAGAEAEKINVYRLRAVVRDTLGKELHQVIVSEVGPKLWEDYQRKKLGGKLDLSTRQPGNVAINSALKCAVSLFIPKLRHAYAERGIAIPANAAAIQWLPTAKVKRAVAADDSLIAAWKGLPPWQPMDRGALYWAVGIARFAGLRREEISVCRRDWLEQRGDVWGFWICDRPEQGFYHKTGEEYFAPIINEAFAAELLALPDGLLVTPPDGLRSEQWFRTRVLEWLRPFTGDAKKPLHRLRGLYADDLKARTQDAELARQKGIKAAAEALGHTSTKTTQDHYLSEA